jgi:ABC-2 type transport system ATP-binding protein
MLDVRNLTKSFNHKPVLHGVDLHVGRGDMLGFIGHNGAGKSTTLKCIMGFVFPDAGEILFNGAPTRSGVFRRSIGFLPEINQMPLSLTAAEYLCYAYGFTGRVDRAARAQIDVLLRDVGLDDTRGKLVRTFSKGMKQRLGIAQAVVHNPQLLILDEPFTGLDPVGKDCLRALLLRQHQAGATVLFSSHNLPEVQDICSVIAVIHGGRVAYQGDTAGFMARFGAGNLEEAFLASYRQTGSPHA